MSGRVFFFSDPHFGHENMAIKRGFASAEEHDTFIIEAWNKVVTKRDVVYLLGDITMENSKHYYKLDLLKGIKKVVLGNHDMPKNITELQKHVHSICGMFSYKGFFVTHCPIHPSELAYRVRGNISGHVHENSIPDKRYVNVSAEAINYTPKLFSEIVAEFEKD